MTKVELIPEIMIKAMAREIKDGDFAGFGLASPLPILAISLAKLTHAPNLVFQGVSEGLDPDLDKVILRPSSADPKLCKGAVAFLELMDVFDLCQRGELGIMFLGAAQIDKYGNTNLSVIGKYDKPKVRLPGGAATAFLTPIMSKFVIWATRQSKRVLVEKVDFRTGVGYLDGGNTREQVGAGATSIKVITNLAVYGFDGKSKIMKVESIHPGITPDIIRENTGFDIGLPENLPMTEMPGEEELHIIQKLDPDNIRHLGFK